ncbi:MAG: SDR family NAD(P)-dependent oxidoreductase [Caldilineaceae bacterium]
MRKRPPIDVLVHNARSISAVGRFAESNLASQRAVLDINFTAPLLLTALLLKNGQIAPTASYLFISSLSHYMSYPGAAVCAASTGRAGKLRTEFVRNESSAQSTSRSIIFLITMSSPSFQGPPEQPMLDATVPITAVNIVVWRRPYLPSRL